MDSFQVVVLAVIQGITEFLPISSSGHLILVPYFADWPDQGLDFDLAVHIGTLLAIVVYFRRTLAAMAIDWLQSLKLRRQVGQSTLAWAVLFGTIPAGVVGLVFRDVIETTLRSPVTVAFTTIGFGVLLGVADRCKGRRDEQNMKWHDVLLIGCAQALALIPGTSRSGITITAGLFKGLTREAAARFSFLLAVPVMTAAGAAEVLSFATSGEPVDARAMGLGLVVSALTGFACIHYFLKWLTRFGLLPYVLYRLVLGAVLIVYVL
jgi:undecaprenyl-diphosphatase